ncbi:hypothetical protein [Porphyromonas endodontalis]|uniref:hypothetical protein n=1 Tax=Porphyromonas endodontalis TaxID=28124 RepID=UPI0028EF9420|nr:hypothetical protein [Porphyromonas endodontalis]
MIKSEKAVIALWKLRAASISQKTTSYATTPPSTPLFHIRPSQIREKEATTRPLLLASSAEVLTFIDKYKQTPPIRQKKKHPPTEGLLRSEVSFKE